MSLGVELESLLGVAVSLSLRPPPAAPPPTSTSRQCYTYRSCDTNPTERSCCSPGDWKWRPGPVLLKHSPTVIVVLLKVLRTEDQR